MLAEAMYLRTSLGKLFANGRCHVVWVKMLSTSTEHLSQRKITNDSHDDENEVVIMMKKTYTPEVAAITMMIRNHNEQSSK